MDWDRMSREMAGQRIARARRRRGMSQEVLAGLIGRSVSWLSQAERGLRAVDSHSVLTRIAEALRVEISEITAGGGPAADGGSGFTPAALIEQAMMGRGTGADGKVSTAAYLKARARSAYRSYQATRYDDAARVAASLIGEAEAASRESGSPEVCEARAMVYDTAAALLGRTGEPFLAWVAADRALAAAEAADLPLLAAFGTWRMSYMVTGRGHPREALSLAMAGAAALERIMLSPSPDQLSVYGALHLAAATAAAATRDRAAATALLAAARGIAEQTGDANHMGTAFGPCNVAIHSVSVSLALGDARAAAEAGEALDPSAMPAGLTGRRTQVSLDLARAYCMRRQDAAAVNLLLAAERLSPQLIRCDWRTRDVVSELLRREHRPSTPELRPLARRAGVI